MEKIYHGYRSDLQTKIYNIWFCNQGSDKHYLDDPNHNPNFANPSKVPKFWRSSRRGLRAPPVSQRFCSAKSVTCQAVRYPQCVHRFSGPRHSVDGILFCLRGSSSAHPWSLKHQLLACVRSYRIFYSARFDRSATSDFHSDTQTSMPTMLTVRRNRTTVRFSTTLEVLLERG